MARDVSHGARRDRRCWHGSFEHLPSSPAALALAAAPRVTLRPADRGPRRAHRPSAVRCSSPASSSPTAQSRRHAVREERAPPTSERSGSSVRMARASAALADIGASSTEATAGCRDRDTRYRGVPARLARASRTPILPRPPFARPGTSQLPSLILAAVLRFAAVQDEQASVPRPCRTRRRHLVDRLPLLESPRARRAHPARHGPHVPSDARPVRPSRSITRIRTWQKRLIHLSAVISRPWPAHCNNPCASCTNFIAPRATGSSTIAASPRRLRQHRHPWRAPRQRRTRSQHPHTLPSASPLGPSRGAHLDAVQAISTTSLRPGGGTRISGRAGRSRRCCVICGARSSSPTSRPRETARGRCWAERVPCSRR